MWLIFIFIQNMQSIRQCVKQLASYSKSAINRTSILSSATNFARTPTCNIHISAICRTDLRNYKTPNRFLNYNKTIFPPQKPGEERRPAVSYIVYVY